MTEANRTEVSRGEGFAFFRWHVGHFPEYQQCWHFSYFVDGINDCWRNWRAGVRHFPPGSALLRNAP